MTLETLCSQPSVLQPSIDALTDRLRPYSVDVACGPLNDDPVKGCLRSSIDFLSPSARL
jgi:hypothetical protein